MTSENLQLDALNEQNLPVMQAYAVKAAAAKAAAKAASSEEAEFDGWLERVNTLPGFTSDDLTTLHGQLIALGFLKFEISGRNVGLRYQISPRGRQALERAVAISAKADEQPVAA